MSRLRQRLARRLHQIAWKLDPMPVSTPLHARVETPMTEAGAEAIADAISGQLGRRVGLSYRDIYGSETRIP